MKLKKYCQALSLALALFLPFLAHAKEITITHRYEADGRILLSWPDNAKEEHRFEDRNLILTFNGPIIFKDSHALYDQASGTIENIRFGYDTFIITFAPGVTPAVDSHAGGMTIRATQSVMPDQNASAELLRIRLLAQRGKTAEALSELQRLEATHPDNAEIYIIRAEIQNQSGYWQKALSSYEKAETLAPHNEDITLARKAIQRRHAPYVDVSGEYRKTGDEQKEFITRAEGEAHLFPMESINLGLAVERNDVDVDALANPADNTVISVDDAFYRGELYLSKTMDNGDFGKISLFGGEVNVGAGLSYTLRDLHGFTVLSAQWNKPNWDYIQTVVAEGTRDRVSIGRSQTITPRFLINAEAGLNQYSLEDFDNAARTVSLDATAEYAISSEHHYADFLGKDASLTLRYTLDAEYAFDTEESTSIFGTYEPLPITSREVHGLVLALGKEITPAFRGEVYAGYAIDRLGGDGPKFGLDFFYDVIDRVQLRAGYLHSVSTERSGEDMDSITAGIRGLF